MTIAYYTKEQVATHNTAASLWVIYDGHVCDITAFAAHHPGGYSQLAMCAGTDVSDLLFSGPHMHPRSVIDDLMARSRIGRVYVTHQDTLEKQQQENEIKRLQTVEKDMQTEKEKQNENEKEKQNENEKENTRLEYLDVTKPLVWQLMRARLSRAEYLEYVHTPCMHVGQTRYFSNPVLETACTMKKYSVTVAAIPAAILLLRRAATQYLSSLASTATTTTTTTSAWTVLLTACAAGAASWSILEYFLHRFSLHTESAILHTTYGQVWHFMRHGVHHLLPYDPSKAQIPLPLLAINAAPILYTANLCLPHGLGHAWSAGLLAMFAVYDAIHYGVHFGGWQYSPRNVLLYPLMRLKSFHNKHHYLTHKLGFGVSSTMWDRVFGTLF